MRFPWQKHNEEVARELAHHLAELTDEYVRRGHSEQEAHQMAKRQFGGEALIQDQCRDESPWAWLQSIGQDLHFGLRQLRQTPVVTAAAVLSLALGIGANSAIISLIDTVLWRTLPVPAPEQLSFLHWQGQGFPEHLADGGAGSMFKDGAERVADFFPMAAVARMQQAAEGRATLSSYSFSTAASVSFAGKPTIAYNRPVGGNFFEVLRLQPGLGRLLREEDNQPSAAGVAVVSHRFYTSFLGGNPKVIGQTLRIDNKPYEIAGVLPESFYGLIPGDSAQIYTPIRLSSEFAKPREGRVALNDARSWVTQVIARRNPGVEQQTILRQLSAAFRQTWQYKGEPRADKLDPRLRLDDGSRGLGDLSRNFREPLFFLGGLLGLVLLIACANIANLLLARATARAKEVALRISLGCSQGRLLRQFLTESALLACFGGIASVGVAYATGKALTYFMTGRDGANTIPMSIDPTMIGSIAGISILTMLLFGLFPAWRASRLDTNSALKEGSGSIGNAARQWWTPGRILIIGQMSLAILLVSAAVLFADNLRNLSTRNPGFDASNLLVFGLRPGTSGYTEAALPGFYQQLERSLAATPGVEVASLATMRPMNQGGWWEDFREVGQSKNYPTTVNAVTSAYLEIFTKQLKAGRNFTLADQAANAPKVAIVSEDLARAIDPSLAVLGRRIHSVGPPNAKIEPIEIVGVAAAIAFNSMKDRPMVVWLPFQTKTQEATVVLRTRSSPSSVLPAIQRTLESIDRNLPMVDPFTMEQLMSRNLQRERMFASLCGSFGVLALLLSVIGLYGVMSYNTSRRRTEIGVRLALGAEPGNVVWMVLREAVALTAAGVLLGSPAIYYASSYLEKELFEMKPLDPVRLSVSLLLLAGSATLAAWLPASRAAALDPATALRRE